MSNTGTPNSRRRIAWFTLGAVAAMLAILYVAGWYATGDRVPHGTTVAGVDIGGLTVDEARDRLDEELGGRASAPVRLVHDGDSFQIHPDAIGLGLDTAQTVSDAGGGHSWNPVRMVDILLGGDNEVDLALEIDREALDAAVTDIAAELNTDPAEPSVSFRASGEPKVTRPVVGLEVDVGGTVDAVLTAYLATTDPVEISAQQLPPSVGADELDSALTELAEPAVSAPITLQLPGRTVDLKVKDYATSLSLVVEDGALTPVIDVGTLTPHIERSAKRVVEDAVDARIVIDGGEPVVIPAAPGVTIDPADVAEAIVPVLTAKGPARVAKVGQSATQPDFTTAEAKALGITETVGEFVTYFPYAEYRNINQGRAAELINGTVLEPDEVFSFNDTVGERTEENGFVTGFIISNGVFAEDLGGGVSQVVTTTYNAAFFAGMGDTEHTPHSFYIDRYPMGREATVAWPTVDLKFGNTTPYGVLIEAWVVPSTVSSQGEMHVRLWSTKYWDIKAGLSNQYDFTSPGTRYDRTDACVATTGYGGFDVDVTRIFRRTGSDRVVDTEVDHVSYTPLDTVICSAPPR